MGGSLHRLEMWERMLKRSTNEVIVPSRYIVRWLGDVLESYVYIHTFICFTLITNITFYILKNTVTTFFTSFFTSFHLAFSTETTVQVEQAATKVVVDTLLGGLVHTV